ncbi:MAG: hypothetical protein WCH04_22705 [Gammaproteobacteria bacterium]
MMFIESMDGHYKNNVSFIAFLLAALFGLLVFGAIIIFSIINNTSLDHVSGAWIAMAMDLRDGVLYRPLFDESTGFGGTRNFPLFFSLIAMAMRVLGSPVLSGHIISFLSGMLLLWGCYMFLRRVEVRPVFAVGLCALLISSLSIRHGFESVRGDVLPLALNVLGLAIYLGKSPRILRVYVTAFLFVMAFAAKLTAVHGVASLFLWLLLTGRGREGLHILLTTLAGYAAFLGFLFFTTSGRIYEIFQVCASGGADIATILKAPIKFAFSMSSNDQESMLILFWAVTIFFYGPKGLRTSLPTIFIAVTLVLTVFLYGSPGVVFNHLVDLSAASVLFVGYAGFSTRSMIIQPSTGIYVALMVFSICRNLWMVNEGLADYKSDGNKYPEQLTEFVMQQEGTLLSEDPLLPIFSNKKPYLLDPFMLRLVMQNDVAIRATVVKEIRSKKYSAIIFVKDPLDNTAWYSDTHFGETFTINVLEHYQETARMGQYVIYAPR